eukprot:TRINITY_DN51572_c0_g1_i1.p1 TRINITY_DN51572_c0_g1~~TRINITY_DN51572_c0_g1_i1.p1  ORF type:complete len:732 (-),score=162.96 TRINITY_DN51572_c0_g1_i1:76-2271(-)
MPASQDVGLKLLLLNQVDAMSASVHDLMRAHAADDAAALIEETAPPAWKELQAWAAPESGQADVESVGQRSETAATRLADPLPSASLQSWGDNPASLPQVSPSSSHGSRGDRQEFLETLDRRLSAGEISLSAALIALKKEPRPAVARRQPQLLGTALDTEACGGWGSSSSSSTAARAPWVPTSSCASPAAQLSEPGSRRGSLRRPPPPPGRKPVAVQAAATAPEAPNSVPPPQPCAGAAAESCSRCPVLEQQVLALAQSLAGLSASVMNAALAQGPQQGAAAAETVLAYLQPCAHLDGALADLCTALKTVDPSARVLGKCGDAASPAGAASEEAAAVQQATRNADDAECEPAGPDAVASRVLDADDVVHKASADGRAATVKGALLPSEDGGHACSQGLPTFGAGHLADRQAENIISQGKADDRPRGRRKASVVDTEPDAEPTVDASMLQDAANSATSSASASRVGSRRSSLHDLATLAEQILTGEVPLTPEQHVSSAAEEDEQLFLQACGMDVRSAKPPTDSSCTGGKSAAACGAELGGNVEARHSDTSTIRQAKAKRREEAADPALMKICIQQWRSCVSTSKTEPAVSDRSQGETRRERQQKIRLAERHNAIVLQRSAWHAWSAVARGSETSQAARSEASRTLLADAMSKTAAAQLEGECSQSRAATTPRRQSGLERARHLVQQLKAERPRRSSLPEGDHLEVVAPAVGGTASTWNTLLRPRVAVAQEDV